MNWSLHFFYYYYYYFSFDDMNLIIASLRRADLLIVVFVNDNDIDAVGLIQNTLEVSILVALCYAPS